MGHKSTTLELFIKLPVTLVNDSLVNKPCLMTRKLKLLKHQVKNRNVIFQDTPGRQGFVLC